MAFEGAQMVPVYDMNKSDGNGFMGSNVIFLTRMGRWLRRFWWC